ncbi:MAG: InlB B-repeat-containing protein [Treponema sp.]|nr:InlB B-repeat-containing protein [Treponema sp.]
MKKRLTKNILNCFLVLISAVSIVVLFLACGNPIIERWWTDDDKFNPININSREFFIVSFNPGPDCKDWVGPQSIIRDGKVERVPAITQSGFVFGGWYPNSSRSGKTWDFENDIVVRDFTLFAKWVPTPYTVKFNTGGGDPQPPDQILIHGTKVKEPPPMENSNQGFGGWYTVNGEGPGGPPWLESNRWNFETPVTDLNTTAGVLNLYAKWAERDITVLFHENGGIPSVPDQLIIHGEKVQPPPPITPTGTFAGFTFGGWLTDESNTNTLWDFDIVITPENENIINDELNLYALWVPIPVSVTFITNGGTPIPQALAVLTGTPAREPRQMSRIGYAFAGWFDNPSFTGSAWDFTTPVKMSMFLYAKWEGTGFTVRFETDGGSPSPADQLVADGGKVQEPLPMLKESYGFGGWYTEKPAIPDSWDEGKRWHFASDTVDENNTTDDVLTLYVRWVETDYYFVKFQSNTSPPFPLKDQIIAEGSFVATPRPMTQVGMNFGGWYTVQPATPDGVWDESKRWVFNSMPVTSSNTDVNGILTLYARWEPARYVVSFQPDGGDPIPGIQYVNFLSKVSKPLPMEKTGYSFGGWFTNEVFVGDEWNFSAPVTKDMTLYAKWISIPLIYTATFFFNDETTPPVSQFLVSGTTIAEPPTPVRFGYGFGGWYTEQPAALYPSDIYTWDEDKRWHFGIPVTANMILYARWETITSRIMFSANEGRDEPDDQVIARGTRVTQPLAMTRPNHYFAGWYANQRFEGLPWNFATGFVTTPELRLYARWIQNDIPPIEIVQRVRIFGVYYVDFAGSQIEFNNPRPGAGASTSLTAAQVNNNTSTVQNVVNIMLQHPDFVLQLSGHANPIDNTDEERAELETISTARSQSVLEEFISKGIPRSSMINAGYNDRIYGDGSRGSLNRCVEIVIVEYLPIK